MGRRPATSLYPLPLPLHFPSSIEYISRDAPEAERL
jgi:hypothetical protein